MQRIKSCRRRLRHPEKLTFAGLRPVRLMGVAANIDACFLLPNCLSFTGRFSGGRRRRGVLDIAFGRVPMPREENRSGPWLPNLLPATGQDERPLILLRPDPRVLPRVAAWAAKVSDWLRDTRKHSR